MTKADHRALLTSLALGMMALACSPAFADPFGPNMTLGASTTIGGKVPLPTTGGFLTGLIQQGASGSVSPFTGSYDSGGSLSWHVGSSYTGLAVGPTIAVPSVVGTPSTQTSAPYTTPDTTDAPQAQVVINTTATAASGYHYNYGVYPLAINLDVSPTLSTLSNPNGTNDVALQMYGLLAPKGGGNCSTVTCASLWITNPDLKVIGTQGQVKVGLVTEDDYNNSYQGTDAFQVNHWFTYGGDYPVTASLYMTNQFTDNYTATATVSGTTVTVTSGYKFDPGLTYMVTVGGQLMRVASVTACSPAQVGHSLCSSSLTLQKSPDQPGHRRRDLVEPRRRDLRRAGVGHRDHAAEPGCRRPLQHHGLLRRGAGRPSLRRFFERQRGDGRHRRAVLRHDEQRADALLRRLSTPAAASTRRSRRRHAGFREQRCIVFDEVGAANGVNHVRVTDAATGGGPSLTVIGSDTNVPLTISAQGTGKVNFGSAVQIPSLQITGTTAATSTSTGAFRRTAALAWLARATSAASSSARRQTTRWP